MELKVFEQLQDQNDLQQLLQLLTAADKEFVPPLSSRSSTTQQSLHTGAGNGIGDYFNEMKQQCFVLALDGEKVAGFMSFKKNYSCEYVPQGENLYASTSVVHPDYRGQGLMRKFYETMLTSYPRRPIYTRTWEENTPHLCVLEKLGFQQIARLENHRGPGVHTVYYAKKR